METNAASCGGGLNFQRIDLYDMLCSAMLCAIIFYRPSFAFKLSRHLPSLQVNHFFRHVSSVFDLTLPQSLTSDAI